MMPILVAALAAAPNAVASSGGADQGRILEANSAILDASTAAELHVEERMQAAGAVATDPDALDTITGTAGFQGRRGTVRLDFRASAAGRGATSSSAVVAEDHVTVPVVDEDSVQVFTVIEGADAPTEYVYKVDLSVPATASVDEDGAVVWLDPEGEMVAGFAPPWAEDALGDEVSTRYEIRGDSVVQIVDHTTLAPERFPVVADPYLGYALIESWSREGLNCSSQGCLYMHSFDISDWGNAQGPNVLRTDGWREALTKFSTVGRYQTTKDQWDCHAAFYLSGEAGVWNLEETRTPSQSITEWVEWSCNWP